TNVDLLVAHRSVVVKRDALGPLNRFVHRFNFPDPITRDELTRLGEWTVSDKPFTCGELYSFSFRSRMKTFTFEHDTGIHQLLVELTHIGEYLLARHNPGL